jgi:hypothetical protein
MERQRALGVHTRGFGNRQDTGGRDVTVHLGIAFISENLKIMLFGQGQQVRPIIGACHGPLRVGRGTQIGNRGTVQNIARQAGVIGQKPGGGGGRHIDGFGTHREGRDSIDLIERVRHQDDGALAAFRFRAKCDCGVEKPFARAI